MYTDDTVIYFSGRTSVNVASILQQDLDKLSQWMTQNKIVFNHSKTKCMLFGTRPRLCKSRDFEITMQRNLLERVTKFKYLGVMFDENTT